MVAKVSLGGNLYGALAYNQDKIDRVTFERMRKFCEKHAMTTGEFIDSPLVTYTEIFKAK